MDDEPRFRGIVFGFGDFSVDREEAMGAEVDFGPGFDEMFDHAVSTAREYKEAITTNGPEDMPDQCIAVLPQGHFHCPIEAMCEGMDIRPPDAIALSLQALRQSMGQPIAVLVLVETVYRHIEHDAPPLPTGALSEAWQRGDQSIHEALTVAMGTPHRYAVEFMPYHYGDGTVVWDEGTRREYDDWPDHEVHENVAEAVRMAFTQEGGTDGTG